MQNPEIRIDGEKLLIRHPGGVVVLVDFSDVRPDLASGAASICGVRMAVKPADVRPLDNAPETVYLEPQENPSCRNC